MVQGNFKIWYRIKVKILLTFPVNRQSFQVLVLWKAATNACHSIHGICLKQSSIYVRFNSDNLSRNSSLHESKCHRCNPNAGREDRPCSEQEHPELLLPRRRSVWRNREHPKKISFCEQNTLTLHIFSCFSALITVSHVTLAQGSSAHHVIHASCAVVRFDLSSTLHSARFTVSLIFYFILLIFHSHLHFPCGSVRREFPCALPRRRSLTFWSTTPLSQFLRGRQIAFMIYDYFRVTGAHDTVLDFMLFLLCYIFALTTFRNSIHDETKFFIYVKNSIR